MTLREDGLASTSVDTASHAVELHYDANADYDIDEITAYAVEVTEGRCRQIKVFVAGELVRHLESPHVRDSTWLDIADEPGNE